MKFLYYSLINYLLRTILRPLSPWLPEFLKFPITGKFKLKINDNKKIKIYCNPTSCFSKILFWEGIKGFEYASVRIFLHLVKNFNVFLDIGANTGYFSLIAQASNPNLTIGAFEPLPAAQKYFMRNIIANGFSKIRLFNIALADKTGIMEFHTVINPKFRWIKDHLSGDGSLKASHTGREDLHKIQIKTETLDHVIFSEKIPIVDLIKLDVESSEHLVLTGAAKVLNDFHPIILCEALPNRIEKELDDILLKQDYRIYKVLTEGLKPIPALLNNTDSENTNYFFVPEHKKPLVEPFFVSRNTQKYSLF